MSWRLVARKEVADAIRARTLWGLATVLAVLGIVGVVLPEIVFADADANAALTFLIGPNKQFVPLLALVAGSLAIAGERESGSLKLLLGLPHSRTDVVVGKLIGRATVVTLAVLVGFAAAGIAVIAVYGTLPIGPFVGIVSMTAFLGVSVVGMAVGISAAAATRARAMAGAVGTFVVFQFLWAAVPAGAYYARHRELPGARRPAWVVLLERLAPPEAYEVASNSFIEASTAGITVGAGGAHSADAAPPLAARVAGDVPFYLDERVGVVILAAWLIVPIALGYLRFRSADLR